MPNLKISRAQNNLLQSKTKGSIFLSAIGGGKSYIIVLKSILLALEGRRGLFVSYSVSNIRDNIIPLFREIFEQMDLVENKDFSISLNPMNVIINGIEIMLRTGSQPNKLRGPSVNFIVIEEAREFLSREIFDVLLGRMRKGSDTRWIIATTTRGKNWVWDILNEEKLLDVFQNDNRFSTNGHCTVVRCPIDEAPHLSAEYIAELKKQYSSTFAAQELEALIVDSSAEVLNPEWLNVMPLTKPRTGIRFWDIATTTKTTSDYSASCFMTRSSDNRYFIYNMTRHKLSYPDLKKKIIETAIDDGVGVHIGFEKVGQQQAIIDDIRREPLLARYVIKGLSITKDKITRAYPLASQAELGNLILNNGSWVREFKSECVNFNAENVSKGHGHDDMVDAATGSFELLTKGSTARLTNIRI